MFLFVSLFARLPLRMPGVFFAVIFFGAGAEF